MFGSSFSNRRPLIKIVLRKEGLIVDDKLVLGADYLFVLDSLYGANEGDTVPIELNNLYVDTGSDLMAYKFADKDDIYQTPILQATILHSANLLDCTIVHARISTRSNVKNRQENERRYAESLGMKELDFPYKSERKALEMMNDRKGYFEQWKARSRITRKTLDWLIFDEPEEKTGEKKSTAEILGKFYLNLGERLCSRATYAENTVPDEEKIEEEFEDEDTLWNDEDERDDSEDTETYEEFLSSISGNEK